MHPDWLAQWLEAWPSKKKKQKIPPPLVRYVHTPSPVANDEHRAFAILELPRGIGPRLFEETSILVSRTLKQKIDNDNNDDPIRNELYHKQQLCVLASPHYRAYHQNLVILARDRSFLFPRQKMMATTLSSSKTSCRLFQMQITLQCVIEGNPLEDHFCIHKGVEHDGKNGYITDVKVLRRAPSNTAGWISLVEVCNINSIHDKKNDNDATLCIEPRSSIIQPAPRQFRKHLAAAGHCVLGNAEGCKSFRGNALLMSAVKLRVEIFDPNSLPAGDNCSNSATASDNSVGSDKNDSNTHVHVFESECDPPRHFIKVLEQEEYFWNQRHSSVVDVGEVGTTHSAPGSVGSTSRITSSDTCLPVMPRAYTEGIVLFGPSSLRLHVSPAVMIPRSGSYTLVDRALKFWKVHEQHSQNQLDQYFESQRASKHEKTEEERACSSPRCNLQDRPGCLSALLWDLGTGSGCLLLGLIKEVLASKMQTTGIVRGIGVDVSPEALDVAKQNAQTLGLAKCCHFALGTFADPPATESLLQRVLLSALQDDIQKRERATFVNIVLCNPPYHSSRLGQRKSLDADTLHYEPSLALHVQSQCNVNSSESGSNTSLDLLVHYREALAGVKRVIHNQSEQLGTARMPRTCNATFLIFEVCRDNANAVHALMHEAGFQNLSTSRDARGCVRSVEGVFVK